MVRFFLTSYFWGYFTPARKKSVKRLWDRLLGLVRDSEVFANWLVTPFLIQKKKKNSFGRTHLSYQNSYGQKQGTICPPKGEKETPFFVPFPNFCNFVLDVGPSLLLVFWNHLFPNSFPTHELWVLFVLYHRKLFTLPYICISFSVWLALP